MKLVTAGILKEFSNLRTTSDLEIIFVLFYSEPKVWVDDWRHEFLREELTKLNFTYLDTRDYFNAYIEKNKGDFSQFYIPSDGHYNDLANTIVAKGLANDISQAMD